MLDTIAGISGIAIGCLFAWNATKAPDMEPSPWAFAFMNLLFAFTLIFVGIMHFI